MDPNAKLLFPEIIPVTKPVTDQEITEIQSKILLGWESDGSDWAPYDLPVDPEKLKEFPRFEDQYRDHRQLRVVYGLEKSNLSAGRKAELKKNVAALFKADDGLFAHRDEIRRALDVEVAKGLPDAKSEADVLPKLPDGPLPKEQYLRAYMDLVAGKASATFQEFKTKVSASIEIVDPALAPKSVPKGV